MYTVRTKDGETYKVDSIREEGGYTNIGKTLIPTSNIKKIDKDDSDGAAAVVGLALLALGISG